MKENFSEHHLTPNGWVSGPKRPADAVGTWLRDDSQEPASDHNLAPLARIWSDEKTRDKEVCVLLSKFPSTLIRTRPLNT